MSLYLKLISSVVSLLILLILTTLYFTGMGSSRYLGEQLSIENLNDANETAQSLTLQQIDAEVIELRLAAKYDLGSYRKIAWLNPEGELVFVREKVDQQDTRHALLKTVFPISALPAEAEISNGWNQLGTLIIQRHEDFHYDELWEITKQMLYALFIAAIAVAILGNTLLRRILSPLSVVVDQAKAIGQRRFISTTIKPSTKEFSELTQSMNELAGRVREMLEAESSQLSVRREQNELDQVTRLFGREAFMSRLRTVLDSDGADAIGSIALTRINDLQGLNRQLGRQQVDTLLADIGRHITELQTDNPSWIAGRLNGSDFCLIAPREFSEQAVAEQLQKAFRSALAVHDIADSTGLPTICRHYEAGDTVSTVMTSLDALLGSTEASADSPILLVKAGADSAGSSAREQGERWSENLRRALTEKAFFIELFPVLDSNGAVVHEEGMLRLSAENGTHNAGEFMPWISRLGLSLEIDKTVTQLAIHHSLESGQNTCVNLTEASVTDDRYQAWFAEMMKKHHDVAEKISLDINESAAFSYAKNFKALAGTARTFGVKLGIEHMGYRIGDIGALSELGMDYLKVDGLFTRDLSSNEGNIALSRTFVGIGKSLGVPCIAEGIDEASELSTVFELGFFAASGRGVKK